MVSPRDSIAVIWQTWANRNMKYSMYVLSLLTATALAGCSLQPSDSRPIDPDKLFAELDQPDVPTVRSTMIKGAKDAEKNQQYHKAISLYKQILDDDPENTEHAFRLANNFRKLGDNDAAIEVYKQILERKPEMIEALEGQALATMAKGEFKEASQLLSEVMEKDKKRWKTLNALGILFATKGLFDEAEAYYAEALAFSPKNSSVLNNIALSKALKDDYSEAVKAAEHAASQEPKHSQKRKHIELNLALIHAAHGDLKAAELVAGRHFEGARLSNNMGLYAHLAENDALAKTYLNSALAGSSVHYQRAWKNLEMLNQTSRGDELAPAQKKVEIQ